MENVNEIMTKLITQGLDELVGKLMTLDEKLDEGIGDVKFSAELDNGKFITFTYSKTQQDQE